MGEDGGEGVRLCMGEDGGGCAWERTVVME